MPRPRPASACCPTRNWPNRRCSRPRRTSAASRAQLSGQIRLGAPDGVANFLLPQVCSAIVERNPDLDVQIVALPRLFNLSRREADMAITVSPPTAGRLTVQKVSD
jgi:DNA-binding transcriptional LysR family regulator